MQSACHRDSRSHDGVVDASEIDVGVLTITTAERGPRAPYRCARSSAHAAGHYQRLGAPGGALQGSLLHEDHLEPPWPVDSGHAGELDVGRRRGAGDECDRAAL